MISGHAVTPVWMVSIPSSWPPAPSWMSVSTLLELEACPRRWALSTADYPHLWGERGYPRAPQLTALEGRIVHSALEKITYALAKNECSSLLDERAFLTLKNLGGYTAIIMDSIGSALHALEGNPRSVPILDGVRLRLLARVAELRSRVQRLLTRISLEFIAAAGSGAATNLVGGFRRQLEHGSHAEVELRAAELGWHGIADFLTLSNSFCEIRDFKTGQPKPEHEFQIRTYALIWARDLDLNPSGRLADRLVLSYDEHDVSVPAPKENEILSLDDDLRRRTAIALADLEIDPPQARPSQRNCAYCVVRHLCEEYWRWHVRQGGQVLSFDSKLTDIQIRLTAHHGPTSWDGIVESSSVVKTGQPILLRTSDTPFELLPEQRIRLLNIHVVVPDEAHVEGESPTVVGTMGRGSELFWVPN